MHGGHRRLRPSQNLEWDAKMGLFPGFREVIAPGNRFDHARRNAAASSTEKSISRPSTRSVDRAAGASAPVGGLWPGHWSKERI